MTAEVDLAEGHLRRGLPLIRWMPPELQLDVALFIHGGLAILRAIREQNYDVWTWRPAISKRTRLRLLWKCWWELKRGRIPEEIA
jgi:phytoene/squalene synthetase